MYSLDEIGLIPARISTIKSRSEIAPTIYTDFGDKALPIFISPMTCIVNKDNIEKIDDYFIPILPVTTQSAEVRRVLPSGDKWNGWRALTLEEFRAAYVDTSFKGSCEDHILIDCAQGHMSTLFELVPIAKLKFPNLKVMTGNIANPETYVDCCKAHIDYVRIGIGGGNGCLTSVIDGTHASIPWILNNIKIIKDRLRYYRNTRNPVYLNGLCSAEDFDKIEGFRTKIIADGGIDTIAKAIKCLALGADYVMIGKMFAHCSDVALRPMCVGGEYYKEYYGQASEQGQIDRFGEVKRHPEGTRIIVKLDTNMPKLFEEFHAGLVSAMSYHNARKLSEFIGKVQWEHMTISEFNSFNK